MPAPDRPSSTGSAMRQTALIVDDEPLVALLLADIVEDAEWDVLGPAATGAEAIALADRTRPDLAFIDVNIEGDQDGVAVAGKLAAQGIKVVLISGYSDLAAEERVQELDPLAVLSKPCLPGDIERLLTTVGRPDDEH